MGLQKDGPFYFQSDSWECSTTSLVSVSTIKKRLKWKRGVSRPINRAHRERSWVCRHLVLFSRKKRGWGNSQIAIRCDSIVDSSISRIWEFWERVLLSLLFYVFSLLLIEIAWLFYWGFFNLNSFFLQFHLFRDLFDWLISDDFKEDSEGVEGPAEKSSDVMQCLFVFYSLNIFFWEKLRLLICCNLFCSIAWLYLLGGLIA